MKLPDIHKYLKFPELLDRLKLPAPPENGGLKYRHELKYLISKGDAEILKRRLTEFMEKDAHAEPLGYYKIRSIYFDDYWDSAYEDKLAGVARRIKHRLRVYNDSDAVIHLERKTKEVSCISKQSACLSRSEAEMLLQGKYAFLRKHPQQLCREFYYDCMAKLMRPRVTVDYEREPYVYPPGDVRVTFDAGLRAALLKFDLFDPHLPSLEIMENGNIILEVKFTEFLPEIIRKILPHRTSAQLAASKYTLACDKAMPLSKRQRLVFN